MYYPEGMKARVSPVQWSKPNSILAPTQDSNPGGRIQNHKRWPLHYHCTLCVLVHLVHIGRSPAYLSDMVTATADLSSRGRLRYSNTSWYELPLLKRKFGERSFSYAGPKAWNDLPFALQELADTCTFKRQLQTHLFTLAYSNCRT